jgi:hypothetical protein
MMLVTQSMAADRSGAVAPWPNGKRDSIRALSRYDRSL